MSHVRVPLHLSKCGLETDTNLQEASQIPVFNSSSTEHEMKWKNKCRQFEFSDLYSFGGKGY